MMAIKRTYRDRNRNRNRDRDDHDHAHDVMEMVQWMYEFGNLLVMLCFSLYVLFCEI